MKGATSSSTPVLFSIKVWRAEGSSSSNVGIKPARSEERRDDMLDRLRYCDKNDISIGRGEGKTQPNLAFAANMRYHMTQSARFPPC